jgi:hypothetical protein
MDIATEGTSQELWNKYLQKYLADFKTKYAKEYLQSEKTDKYAKRYILKSLELHETTTEITRGKQNYLNELLRKCDIQQLDKELQNDKRRNKKYETLSKDKVRAKSKRSYEKHKNERKAKIRKNNENQRIREIELKNRIDYHNKEIPHKYLKLFETYDSDVYQGKRIPEDWSTETAAWWLIYRDRKKEQIYKSSHPLSSLERELDNERRKLQYYELIEKETKGNLIIC